MRKKWCANFRSKHAVLPVIHVADFDQARRNTDIAHAAGADGVFLINHHIGSSELLRIYHAVAAEHPNWWIGLNCLDRSPLQVFAEIPATLSGLWVDNAGIEEGRTLQQFATSVQEVRAKAGWAGLYFGGVAFKYQRPVDDLAAAGRIAKNYIDVVTTSGPGTGKAAAVSKIATLRESLGDHPLAIASGITPENVSEYLEIADCFLVATGISASFTELNPGRVKALVASVRQHDGAAL